MKFSLIFIIFFLFSCSNGTFNKNNNKSYTSKGFALIYDENDYQKNLIESNIKKFEKKFKKKVVTYVREFEIFYKAEDKHQDYYQVYLENYLKYKKACKRERILDIIWGS